MMKGEYNDELNTIDDELWTTSTIKFWGLKMLRIICTFWSELRRDGPAKR